MYQYCAEPTTTEKSEWRYVTPSIGVVYGMSFQMKICAVSLSEIMSSATELSTLYSMNSSQMTRW
jgi:hypothetical protein